MFSETSTQHLWDSLLERNPKHLLSERSGTTSLGASGLASFRKRVTYPGVTGGVGKVGATTAAVLQAQGGHTLAAEGSAFQSSSDSLVFGLG